MIEKQGEDTPDHKDLVIGSSFTVIMWWIYMLNLAKLQYTVRLEPSSSSPRPQTPAGVRVGGSLPG